MRILFITHAFNSLTQRLYCELTARGHLVSIEFDIADSVCPAPMTRLSLAEIREGFGGHVTIGPRTLVGVGAKLKPHVTIGADSIIGVGAVVVKDVPDQVMVAGVPAQVIRTLERPGESART